MKGTVGAEALVWQNYKFMEYTGAYKGKAVGRIIGMGCILQTVDKSR